MTLKGMLWVAGVVALFSIGCEFGMEAAEDELARRQLKLLELEEEMLALEAEHERLEAQLRSLQAANVALIKKVEVLNRQLRIQEVPERRHARTYFPLGEGRTQDSGKPRVN